MQMLARTRLTVAAGPRARATASRAGRVPPAVHLVRPVQQQQRVQILARTAAPEAPSSAAARAPGPPSGVAGGLLELDQATFWDYLAEQGDTLVVVDFYSDWCGPCKLMAPDLLKLAEERSDIRVVKFNCNKANKALGLELGVKVAPTFHLYRNSKKVSEVTGARMDELLGLIDEATKR